MSLASRLVAHRLVVAFERASRRVGKPSLLISRWAHPCKDTIMYSIPHLVIPKPTQFHLKHRSATSFRARKMVVIGQLHIYHATSLWYVWNWFRETSQVQRFWNVVLNQVLIRRENNNGLLPGMKRIGRASISTDQGGRIILFEVHMHCILWLWLLLIKHEQTLKTMFNHK